MRIMNDEYCGVVEIERDDRHEVKSLKLSSAFVEYLATNAAPRTNANLERITLHPIILESSRLCSHSKRHL